MPDLKEEIPPDANLIDWSHLVAAVPERGLEQHQIASAQVCEAVASALGIMACNRIEARYRVRAAGAGSFRVKGRISVDVIQAALCSHCRFAASTSGTR